MSIEAMKQALEALEIEDSACRHEKEMTPEHIASSIAALRQAIQQAEKQTHTDHPARHWDKTCPACVTEQHMSTKPENIDTKSGCVDGININILRQSEREGWRWAKECEAEVERLKVIIYEFEGDDLPKREWQGLTVRDYHEFLKLSGFDAFKAIEAALRSKNT